MLQGDVSSQAGGPAAGPRGAPARWPRGSSWRVQAPVRWPWPWLTLAAALVWLAPAVASAQATVIIVEGDTDPVVRASIETSAHDRLRAAGLETRRAAGGNLAARDVLACARGTARDCGKLLLPLGISRVLLIRADQRTAAGGGIGVDVRGTLTDQDGRPLASDAESCDRCSSEELALTTATLCQRLLEASKQTRLNVSTTPPGARVTVDGEDVGTTPVTVSVPAGRRSLSFVLDGYAPVVRAVDAQPGQSLDLMIPLGETADVPASGRRRAGPLPWVLAGAGVATVTTAVVLLLSNTDAIEGGVVQPERTNNTVPAAILTGAGVGLLAAAVYLFVSDGKSSSAPVLSAGRGGVVLGWTGRF